MLTHDRRIDKENAEKSYQSVVTAEAEWKLGRDGEEKEGKKLEKRGKEILSAELRRAAFSGRQNREAAKDVKGHLWIAEVVPRLVELQTAVALTGTEQRDA
jgi:hypothetical protein